MRKFLAIIICGLAFQAAAKAEENLIISSPDFKNGEILSKEYEFSGFGCSQALLGPYDICSTTTNRYEGLSCNGKNRAPTIKWGSPPRKTQSFALIVRAPDMPTGNGWWNFIVYNIPRDIREIEGGKIPAGAIAAKNDSGTPYYMGPCPPNGSVKQRYIFTIYALDSALDLPPSTTPGIAAYMINRHALASASLIAMYERK